MKYLILYDFKKTSEIERLLFSNSDMKAIRKGLFWRIRFWYQLNRVDNVIVYKSSIRNSENVQWELARLRDHDLLIVIDDSIVEDINITTKANIVAIKNNQSKLSSLIRRASLSNSIETLFPKKVRSEYEKEFMFKMLETSESLINRRQTTNNCMISVNAILLTLIGVLLGIDRVRDVVYSIIFLPMIGIIICFSWFSLLTSFGKLNKAKFEVICYLEKRLKIPIFNAEWKHLSRRSIRYKSFTNTEKWLPMLVSGLYVVVFVLMVIIYITNIPNGGEK